MTDVIDVTHTVGLIITYVLMVWAFSLFSSISVRFYIHRTLQCQSKRVENKKVRARLYLITQTKRLVYIFVLSCVGYTV